MLFDFSPEPDDGEAEDALPELPPPPVRRAAEKAGHRQLRTPIASGAPSWWVTQGRDGFTRIGEQETAKTAHTRAGASVGFRLLQE